MALKFYDADSDEFQNIANKQEGDDTPKGVELNDDNVLKYIAEKRGEELKSFDDLVKEKIVEKEVELPNDVSQFLKYKNDTGRGLADFIRSQEDFTSLEPTEAIKRLYAEQNPSLNASDIQTMVDLKFKVDDDASEETKSNKALELKLEQQKALKYLQEQKDKYGAKLESNLENIPKEYQEALDIVKKLQSDQEAQNGVRDIFTKKTNDLFNADFKGFEFDLGDKKQVYEVKDVDAVKDFNSNIGNFLKAHQNDDGTLKDANAYHKALTIAQNPEAFAKYFYEQGKSDLATHFGKDIRNIDMNFNKGTGTPNPNQGRYTFEGGNTPNKRRGNGLSINMP